jgi:hypothetical protein
VYISKTLSAHYYCHPFGEREVLVFLYNFVWETYTVLETYFGQRSLNDAPVRFSAPRGDRRGISVRFTGQPKNPEHASLNRAIDRSCLRFLCDSRSSFG